MCERTGHRRHASGTHSAHAEHWNEICRDTCTSHAALTRQACCCSRRRPSKKALLLPSPLAPRWLWALLPKGEFQHAAARLPRPTASPVEKSTPDVVAGACASLLRSAHLPMNRRCCSALTERGPFFRACLHRMHRRLSCRKVHPRYCRSLRPFVLGANAFELPRVRTCWMRWTSRKRSLSHCASGGTNSMRTRATYVLPLRSQPRQMPDQLHLQMDRLDPIEPYAHSHTPCPCPCHCVLHAATKQLCACSVWLCACSAWHLYF